MTHWQSVAVSTDPAPARGQPCIRLGPPRARLVRRLAHSTPREGFRRPKYVRIAAARPDGVVLWNLKRLAGTGAAVARVNESANANVGVDLVEAVKGRYGLEIVL